MIQLNKFGPSPPPPLLLLENNVVVGESGEGQVEIEGIDFGGLGWVS